MESSNLPELLVAFMASMALIASTALALVFYVTAQDKEEKR